MDTDLPVNLNGENNMTDSEILALYSAWSEDYYCAGFITANPGTVKQFRTWLQNPHKRDLTREPMEDYEQEMLIEFHKQEREAPKKIWCIECGYPLWDTTRVILLDRGLCQKCFEEPKGWNVWSMFNEVEEYNERKENRQTDFN